MRLSDAADRFAEHGFALAPDLLDPVPVAAFAGEFAAILSRQMEEQR